MDTEKISKIMWTANCPSEIRDSSSKCMMASTNRLQEALPNKFRFADARDMVRIRPESSRKHSGQSNGELHSRRPDGCSIDGHSRRNARD